MRSMPEQSVRAAGRGFGPLGAKAERRIALTLCAVVVVAWALERIVPFPADDAPVALAPDWLPLLAVGLAATGMLRPSGPPPWLRARRVLSWSGVLLLVWAANGLPFDLLTAAGLIGHRTADGALVMSTVYLPGLVARAAALACAVVLARPLLASPATQGAHPATWYGYAAFVVALPYPVLRVHWAIGGTLGLAWAGAAGDGFEPLLIAFPWLLAAILSLLLVSPRPWIPRRLLLAAGWIATAIVAMIGPAACWAVVSTLLTGAEPGLKGIESWVPLLFYGSWLLWAIAGGAATRSYQLRTAPQRMSAAT